MHHFPRAQKVFALIALCAITSVVWVKLAVNSRPPPRTSAHEQRAPDSPPGFTPALGCPAGFAFLKKAEDAPPWAIAFAKEFWLEQKPELAAPHSFSPTIPDATRLLPAGINVGDVMERVSHAISLDANEGSPKLKARFYTATFESDGFRISPHRSSDPVADEGFLNYQPDPDLQTTFRTLAVRQGSQTLFGQGQPSTDWSFVGNTGQRLLNTDYGLIEHYQARAEGVEVTWVLKNRPAGRGDVIVEAELQGLRFDGEDSAGHSFANETGGGKLRVGHATLVDASGVRMDVPMLCEGSRFQVAVAENLLGTLTYPIAIDPVVGPAIGGGFAMAPQSQHEPAVAWNSSASQYLVVWQDYRSGIGWDIYGTRVSGLWGAIRDPGGIAICTATNDQGWPRVASDGNDWLVVWHDLRNPTFDVYGSRVDSSGSVASAIAISTTSYSEMGPAVAAVGTNYLVAWEDTRESEGSPAGFALVYAAIVSGNSVSLVSSGLGRLCHWDEAGDLGQRRVRVAASTNQYLVIWDGQNWDQTYGVYGARVSATGSVTCMNLLSRTNILAGYGGVASTGNGWCVVWSDYEETYIDVWARLIDNSGTLQTPFEVTDSDYESEWRPAVAGSATNYLVVWHHQPYGSFSYNIRGSRISTAGVPQDGSNGFDVCSTAEEHYDISIASKGDDYIVVWASGLYPDPDEDPSYNIYGSRVANATVIDRFPISTTNSPFQGNITVGGNGGLTEVLLAWEDTRNINTTGWDIYGARLSSDGRILDLNGLAIATNSGSQLTPAAAYGPDFFVVWDDAGRIKGRSVSSSDGTLSPIIDVTTDTSTKRYPSLAGISGSSLLCVFEDTFNAWQGYSNDIYAVRITFASPNWQAGSKFTVYSGVNNQTRPAVGSDEAIYFVAWEHKNSTRDIHGRLVTSAGGLTNSVLQLCINSQDQSLPAVAGRPTGNGFAVVWQDARSGSGDIYGIPVSNDGVVGTPTNGVQISTTSGFAELRPAVAHTGSAFMAAWTDYRGATHYDIYGSRLSVTNNVMSVNDLGGFGIKTETRPQQLPAMGTIYDGSYKAVVGYESYFDFGNGKVRAIIVAP
jgi:hypothetical protein